VDKQDLPARGRLQPTWLLVAWLPLCAAQIWLNASILRRDGFGSGRMAIVIGASILLGMVLTDLHEVFHRWRAARAGRGPADSHEAPSGP